jgi:hypothetical protein
VRLLVIDEAARVPDELYRTVRPMLAVSRGRLVALSSAFAQSGWFYEAFSGGEGWERYKVPAALCPRIDPTFLEEERAALGPVWYAMEYECVFTPGAFGLFRPEDIEALTQNDLQPLEL